MDPDLNPSQLCLRKRQALVFVHVLLGAGIPDPLPRGWMLLGRSSCRRGLGEGIHSLPARGDGCGSHYEADPGGREGVWPCVWLVTQSVTPGATQGSCLPGCKAPGAVSCQHGSSGMLLLRVVGLEVSGSSCAAANNEENNKTVREMFSQY